MPVIPFSKDSPVSTGTPRGPDPTFLMMAAAQMNKEGRLVQDIPDYVRGPQTGPPGFKEGETIPSGKNFMQGEPGQPEQPQIKDIQRQFSRRITENAPQSDRMGGKFLRDLIKSGHLYSDTGI